MCRIVLPNFVVCMLVAAKRFFVISIESSTKCTHSHNQRPFHVFTISSFFICLLIFTPIYFNPFRSSFIPCSAFFSLYRLLSGGFRFLFAFPLCESTNIDFVDFLTRFAYSMRHPIATMLASFLFIVILSMMTTTVAQADAKWILCAKNCTHSHLFWLHFVFYWFYYFFFFFFLVNWCRLHGSLIQNTIAFQWSRIAEMI